MLKTPPEPGYYPNMPASEYHEYSGASASRLKDMMDSPAHMRYKMLNPKPPTKDMITGTAVHSRILEPDKFFKEFVKSPNFDRRTNAGKAAADDFALNNLGKTIILPDQFEICQRSYDSVMSHPDVRKLLEADGECETSLFWKFREINCKARIDKRVLVGDQKMILDVKTTSDASPEGFPREITNWRYDLQAAFYQAGENIVNGDPPSLGFLFLAIEKEPPYAFGLYLLDEASLDVGQKKFLRMLDLWEKCDKDDVWPHYTDLRSPALKLISLPSYAMPKF
jgi:exodeoxyribonuclease VIII